MTINDPIAYEYSQLLRTQDWPGLRMFRSRNPEWCRERARRSMAKWRERNLEFSRFKARLYMREKRARMRAEAIGRGGYSILPPCPPSGLDPKTPEAQAFLASCREFHANNP